MQGGVDTLIAPAIFGTALTVLMVLDILTAIWRCAVLGAVMSRRLTVGVTIKTGILLVVTLTYLVDRVIARYFPGMSSIIPFAIGNVVALWYMLGELLSILENLHKMGVPLPGFLVRILAVARKELSSQAKYDKMADDSEPQSGQQQSSSE